MVDYALKLLAHGFLCVPLSRNGRHLDLQRIGYVPLHLQTRQKKLKELCFCSVAFQLSQQPPAAEIIRNWFTNFDGNIGIIGGYGGLLILDFDRPAIYQKWRNKYSELAATTPVAKSPHGHHVFLKTMTPIVSSSLHFGFCRAGHVKALGGYILCAPSKLSDGSTYQWLPKQSPFDVAPRMIENLQSLSLSQVSWLKAIHDHVLKRGQFEPD